MLYQKIISKLKSLSNPEAVKGMARFGINPNNTLGISIPQLRALAKQIGKPCGATAPLVGSIQPAAEAHRVHHSLALQLWDSGIHEARILAGLIDQPEKVTEKQMDKWVRDFDSWDVCDGSCMNLFDRLEIAPKKAVAWSKRKEEFVKRAGFALMACLAWHRQEMPDREFIRFLPLIKRESTDNRNFVKKAVNWALRQIGKRNLNLNKHAVKAAREIAKMDSGCARWIAADAIRELTGQPVQTRLREAKR